MAKVSSVEKNKRRRYLASQKRQKRSVLKKLIMDKSKPLEERFQATLRLAAFPRNSAPSRVRRRCRITGRARGNYEKFEISRITLRRMALEGLMPGVTKASW